jgi:TorA maturation chaperone TorD
MIYIEDTRTAYECISDMNRWLSDALHTSVDEEGCGPVFAAVTYGVWNAPWNDFGTTGQSEHPKSLN